MEHGPFLTGEGKSPGSAGEEVKDRSAETAHWSASCRFVLLASTISSDLCVSRSINLKEELTMLGEKRHHPQVLRSGNEMTSQHWALWFGLGSWGARPLA